MLNEAGNNTIFTPIVMSACGAMGPSMVAFLKEVYGRAKEADKFLMSQQPALKHSWNTMVVSLLWDMRLSIEERENNFKIPMRLPLPIARARTSWKLDPGWIDELIVGRD